MMKGRKNRSGVVYSTNPEYNYQYPGYVEPKTLPPGQQNLRVGIDRHHRKGKTVTLVRGFTGSEKDLTELGRMLKTKCGSGGSVKEGEIIIQGDFSEKVMKLLAEDGYKVKKGL
jgi:translation initiation factor 1